MTFTDKLKQLLKCPSKRPADITMEIRRDAQNADVSADTFEKKYKKWKDQELKKIFSMSKEEKEHAMELTHMLDDLNMKVLDLAPLIKNKYEIVQRFLKEYQDALRKTD